MTDKEKTMENLRMVLEELPKLAEKIPSIRDDFDMDRYGCYEELEPENINECQARGCLLGNIARLFPMLDKYFNEFGEFDYDNFCIQEFPMLDSSVKGLNKNWCFLFDMSWSLYQPTFDQAMNRVKYFIECDGELGEWYYQKEDFI